MPSRGQFAQTLSGRLDEDSDDKNALDDRVRAEQLAQISSDLLATERLECQLIEAAKAVDTVLDFREDAIPARTRMSN